MLENKVYFEMSKDQIIDCFRKILSMLENWKKYFNKYDIYHIQEEYKDLESDISELEMCLVDKDDIFHCEGISYALYQIGNILREILLNNKTINNSDKN